MSRVHEIIAITYAAPLHRTRLPEVHRSRPMEPAQEMAIPEEPDPPHDRKEVMPS